LLENCRCWKTAVAGKLPLLENCRCWKTAVAGKLPLLENCRCRSFRAVVCAALKKALARQP
jgi:hypothetical protein